MKINRLKEKKTNIYFLPRSSRSLCSRSSCSRNNCRRRSNSLYPS